MAGLTNLLVILFFLAAGYGCNRLVRDPIALAHRLYDLVIKVAVPALILRVIPGLELPGEAAFMVAAPWGIMGINGLIVLTLSRYLGWQPATTCGLFILAGLGNTGFLGFALIQAFFSDVQLGFGILFDQFGSFLGVCTLGSLLVALYSRDRQPGTPGILKRILSFPPFVTLILAFFVPSAWISGSLYSVLEAIGWSIVPLTMFSIGLQFSFRTEADLWAPLAWILALKMLAAPVLILGLGQALGIAEAMLDVAIFQAAMPPMVVGAVLLTSSGVAPRLAASALGFGTLVALLYLPALAWLLNSS